MAIDASIPVYFRNHKFLTLSERRVFQSIIEALPNHWVFPQVAMSALVVPKPGIDVAREHIAQKYVDFAILDHGFNVVAVLELDDPSHERPDRQKADAQKDYALKSAGIRVARIKKNNVSAEAIRSLVTLTEKQWATPTRRKTSTGQK